MVNHWLPVLAGLVAALMAALVLWPLRHHGRRGFVVVVFALGVAGACLYLLVGDPRAAQVQPTPSVATLRDGVQALQDALKRDPQRADGWALLGRSQAELGNASAAADAFAKAAELAPDDPGVLVEAAQARAQADAGKQFDDTAMAWLQQARTQAPDAERASWLLGIALRQRGRNAEAADVWSGLLPRLEPGAAQALQAQIAIAREAAGQAPDAGAAAPPAPPAQLQVRVQLPALNNAEWPASTQVFVLARAVGGPPMPVAARKLPLSGFPDTVGLGDGDSPMPTAPLSAHREVEVLARISRTGSANRSEGDLQSDVVRVTLPHEGVVELRFP
ncbi:cytochrome c biogenesis protein [Stenotrophomonas maltophilia]|jgi:cytochrome c-type biogenesis protein CcmH|uniref:Cytochrome c biogenesis protein n=1 Tax=Stenotrophomonas maltophilia TaxID=40324 RepID=A0AAX1ICW3_STEMA|nr:cytochrome C biogenesis protein [Stenotrophomonas maltophilia]QGL81144.1 cytochrome C biogenesis protein [Stenotrophomonas maltophilia]QNG77905.1 cytochrome c biogenesis protein [Stenotrophomonas maltophilia]